MKKFQKSIALIYGSDMGATEEVAATIYKKINIEELCVIDVYNINPSRFLNFDILILGVPTWYIGDLQSAWDEFFPEFKKINFKGIKVGFFGLGDQYGYPDNFIDGIGILAKVVQKNGGEIFGYWKNECYDFNLSLGMAPNNMFYGLVIDEDNQYELTEKRIDKWVEHIKKELKI
jgi:flavodoxin I